MSEPTCSFPPIIPDELTNEDPNTDIVSPTAMRVDFMPSLVNILSATETEDSIMVHPEIHKSSSMYEAVETEKPPPD
jgi:hypothetical protein